MQLKQLTSIIAITEFYSCIDERVKNMDNLFGSSEYFIKLKNSNRYVERKAVMKTAAHVSVSSKISNPQNKSTEADCF